MAIGSSTIRKTSPDSGAAPGPLGIFSMHSPDSPDVPRAIPRASCGQVHLRKFNAGLRTGADLRGEHGLVLRTPHRNPHEPPDASIAGPRLAHGRPPPRGLRGPAGSHRTARDV